MTQYMRVCFWKFYLKLLDEKSIYIDRTNDCNGNTGYAYLCII